MRQAIRQLKDQLGWQGMAGIVLLLLASLFQTLRLEPMELETTLIRNRMDVERAKSAVEDGIFAGGSQQQDLAVFFDSLPAEEEITDILASISAIADATGVELKQVDYRLNEQDQPRVEYVMNFPVRGEYVRIRAFLSLVLSNHPALALDHAGFQRDSIDDATLKAMVQLTLFIRPIK